MPEFDEDRARRLAILADTPAWADLQEHVKDMLAKWLDTHARELMASPPGTALEQGRLDYDRGWYAGAAALLDLPRKARAKLDQAIGKE